MKKFLLSLGILFSITNINASPIHSYDDFSTALKEGHYFAIVANLAGCTGNNALPIGSFSPNALLIVPKTNTLPEHITTSDLHFTNHAGSPVYEYIKYTFNPDNTVAIEVDDYDPQTFKALDPPTLFNCLLNKNVNVDDETSELSQQK